jgi:hypothetical protein
VQKLKTEESEEFIRYCHHLSESMKDMACHLPRKQQEQPIGTYLKLGLVSKQWKACTDALIENVWKQKSLYYAFQDSV